MFESNKKKRISKQIAIENVDSHPLLAKQYTFLQNTEQKTSHLSPLMENNETINENPTERKYSESSFNSQNFKKLLGLDDLSKYSENSVEYSPPNQNAMKKSDELYMSEHTKLECILNNLKKSLNIDKTDEV